MCRSSFQSRHVCFNSDISNFHLYTRNPNLETSEDSRNLFLHWEDVSVHCKEHITAHGSTALHLDSPDHQIMMVVVLVVVMALSTMYHSAKSTAQSIPTTPQHLQAPAPATASLHTIYMYINMNGVYTYIYNNTMFVCYTIM